jgi:hypothetical protein
VAVVAAAEGVVGVEAAADVAASADVAAAADGEDAEAAADVAASADVEAAAATWRARDAHRLGGVPRHRRHHCITIHLRPLHRRHHSWAGRGRRG